MLKPIITLASAMMLSVMPAHAAARDDVSAAAEVINRFAGNNLPLDLQLTGAASDGCDEYEISVSDGRISVKGSSQVALCRGFYDFTRRHGAGICSWSGSRFVLPDLSADEAPLKVRSP